MYYFLVYMDSVTKYIGKLYGQFAQRFVSHFRQNAKNTRTFHVTYMPGTQ